MKLRCQTPKVRQCLPYIYFQSLTISKIIQRHSLRDLNRGSEWDFSSEKDTRNKERYQNDPWLSITLSLPK